MSLENALWGAGVAAELAVVALLIYRRAWKNFPVFCTYLAWTLLSDTGNFIVRRSFGKHYLAIYLIETSIDAALQFGILVELMWSVLRPIRKSLSPLTLLIIALLILGLGGVIWPFTGIEQWARLAPDWRILIRVQQSTAILRILIFLLIAGLSQLLSISWRDRELQIATGLGIYSIISVTVEALHAHQVYGPAYRHLNEFVVISYLGSLLYWAVSFATQESKRREFTPEIQNALLAMAGAARATRVALHDSTPTSKGLHR
jgi:hypothetical protein